MKRHLAAAAMAGVVGSASLAAETYTIDSEHTVPTFEISHLGFSTQSGRFNKATGTITLDRAARKGSVDATIFTDSLDMSSPAWTAHMKAEGLFNVEKFPTMTFRSTNLVFSGSKVVAAEGELSLCGVTKSVRVEVKGFQCARNPRDGRSMCSGDVSASLRRSDFGMTKYIPEVSDELTVKIPVEAYRD
jgi:polyisoprenoid-binding protein YceI